MLVKDKLRVVLNNTSSMFLNGPYISDSDIQDFRKEFGIKDEDKDEGIADETGNGGQTLNTEKNTFAKGHIKKCWDWAQKLAESNRPVFFPRPKQGDAFILFSDQRTSPTRHDKSWRGSCQKLKQHSSPARTMVSSSECCSLGNQRRSKSDRTASRQCMAARRPP